MVARVIPVDPFDLVIFGGTGDLARRKILPSLYRRFWIAGQMPDGGADHRCRTVSEMDDADWYRGKIRRRRRATSSSRKPGENVTPAQIDANSLKCVCRMLHPRRRDWVTDGWKER